MSKSHVHWVIFAAVLITYTAVYVKLRDGAWQRWSTVEGFVAPFDINLAIIQAFNASNRKRNPSTAELDEFRDLAQKELRKNKDLTREQLKAALVRHIHDIQSDGAAKASAPAPTVPQPAVSAHAAKQSGKQAEQPKGKALRSSLWRSAKLALRIVRDHLDSWIAKM
jgi:hypothetical protein